MWADFLNTGFQVTLWLLAWQFIKLKLINKDSEFAKAMAFIA